MLNIDKRKKVTKPDYPKKIGSSKKFKKVVKMTVFLTFSWKWLTILMKLAQNVELINSEHLTKTCMSKSFSVDNHPQSSDNGPNCQKNV